MPEENETPQPPEEGKPARTFTQDEVNAMLAESKRKQAAKFADYDDIKAKAAKFDAVQDAAKTELQKATERAQQAEARAAQLEQAQQVASWAAEIVKDTPVPAAALRGSTREELEAHFELLKPLVAGQGQVRTATPAVGAGRASGVGSGPAPRPGSAAEALRRLRRGE